MFTLFLSLQQTASSLSRLHKPLLLSLSSVLDRDVLDADNSHIGTICRISSPSRFPSPRLAGGSEACYRQSGSFTSEGSCTTTLSELMLRNKPLLRNPDSLFLHRPANILLTARHVPVFVDFGFAEEYEVGSKRAFLSNLAYGTPEVRISVHGVSRPLMYLPSTFLPSGQEETYMTPANPTSGPSA